MHCLHAAARPPGENSEPLIDQQIRHPVSHDSSKPVSLDLGSVLEGKSLNRLASRPQKKSPVASEEVDQGFGVVAGPGSLWPPYMSSRLERLNIHTQHGANGTAR